MVDLLRKHEISRATFFKWRSASGGASVSHVKRLRELVAENAKLKRMYAHPTIEDSAIKDVLTDTGEAVREVAGRSRHWCTSIGYRFGRPVVW